MRDGFARTLCAAAGAALGCVRMTSFDLPLMVACGERVLATGRVPETNPYHWPHPGHAWLDDKWGFGVLCAAFDGIGGGAALTALNALLGALAGLLLHALARRRASPWTALGIALAATTALSYRSMLRAEWISILGVGWTLLHLEGVLAGRARNVIATVAAIPLWAACHVYWFIAPAVLVAAAVLRPSVRAAVCAMLCVAAAAVSPYGLANVLHPFHVAATAPELAESITELRLPFSGGPVTFFHVLATALAVFCAVRATADWRAGRRAEAGITAALVVLAFRYDRNLAFTGIAAVWTAAPRREDADRARHAWPGAAAVVAVAGLACGVPWLTAERRAGAGWDETALPVRLAASLPPETRGMRWVNDFSVGSFLDRVHGSSFIDGNTHGWPLEHFAFYRRALEGTVGVAEVDRRFPNDGWFLRTSSPTTRVLVVGLLLEGDYAPTDWDEVATLFRPVPDPEAADALWRRWLSERYLPVARAWFPKPSEILGPSGALPAQDDVDAWRRLLAQSPWERAFLDGLRRACDLRRDDRQAARVWRIRRRLPE